MASHLSFTQVAGPHLATYETFFKQADSNGHGVVGALEAANYLKRSGLKEAVLSQIWDQSDPAGKGYLDKQGFFVALKLIALAQNGKEANISNIGLQTAPPNMGTPASPAMGPLGSGDSSWAIQPSERNKYDDIFEGLHPVNGLLSGDKVRPVLLNSKLPVDVLGRVWDLSDIDKDGFLDVEEFSVAMHLVYKALEKHPVPLTLSAELIPPSKRKKGAALPGAVSVLPPTGGLIDTTRGSPVLGIASPRPLPVSTATNWVVTPTEKAQCDEMFKTADTDMDGLVNGVELKDIFLQTGVPQPVLAHIWNLCDTKGLGKLNCEQFALAMHLINLKIKGLDPPQQLTPEMMPPSSRQANLFLDDIRSPPGSASDYSTHGMQELDMITKEINDLKSKKMTLEQEKAQKEADIKVRNSEVAALQKELDSINSTFKQLETQKGEAQKRLQELDDKRTKLENDMQEVKEKCEEERKQLAQLKSQAATEETSGKIKEEELKRMRDELSKLRQEEVELEQKVEAGKTQLEQFLKNMSETQSQVSQSKCNIQKLEEVQNSMNQAISQYQALISGDTNATEPRLTTLTPITLNDMDQMSSKATAGSSSVGSMSNFSSFSGLEDFKDAPFKSKDPFANTNGEITDPFPPEENHYEITGIDDPFKGSDPFKPDAFDDDPFKGSDPFKEPFGSSTTSALSSSDVFSSKDPFSSDSKKSKDPFGEDPFGSHLATAKPTTATNDPFGSAALHNLVSPVNPNDPFGTDPFKPASKSRKSPAPSLPPKQKRAAPPRPPAPKKGSASPVPGKTNAKPAPDPFEGKDPFGGSMVAPPATSAPSGADTVSAFADFSPSKFSSEAEQLAWAAQDSQNEWQKQRRLADQEKADLELAIALSKADMSTS